MSYHPSFYFNPSSQTQPQQQQQQQKQQQQSYRTLLPTAVQSAVLTAVPTAVPTSAPWHQQQAVYQPDFTTRYVYDSSNPNPPTPPTDSLHSPANHQNQTAASVMSSPVITTPVITSPVSSPEKKSNVSKKRGNDLFSHTAVSHEQIRS